MVQKAAIDLLTNLPEIEINDDRPPTDLPVAPLPDVGKKLAFGKICLIGAPVLLVVLFISGALWFYYFRPAASSVTKSAPAAAAAQIAEKKTTNEADFNKHGLTEPIKMHSAYFKDFIVELKDKTGKSRILMYDVVCDLHEGNDILELEKRKDVRNLIYQTAKGKNVIALKSVEERKKLKQELAAEMNKLCGEGVIKEVYFANFVIM